MRAVEGLAGDVDAADFGEHGSTPESLFRDHYVRLSRTAMLLTDDPGAAEEIVQDAFAELVARWSRIDSTKAVAYLYRTVVNGGRSALRRRRTVRSYRPDRAVDVPGADEVLIRSARDDLLRAAVAKLPRRQQQVVVLRFYSNRSVTEVAQTLQIKASAVAVATQHALKALRSAREELT